MPMKLSTRKLLQHVIAWVIFVFYEVSIVLVLNPKGTLWWEYTGYYLLNILLFYLNAHVLFSYVFRKSRPTHLLLLLIPLELAFYTMAELGMESFFNVFRTSPVPITLDLRFVLGRLWRGVYFLGLSTAYWFVLSTIERNRRINQLRVQQAIREKEKAELEHHLAQSQNAYLRAQINPHMLFNTLSFIYSTVQDASPKASEGIMLLSEVMHYALGPVHADGKTDLSREITHIQNYIALNQLRFSKPLQLQLCLEGQFNHRFPPLLLLTFIENMFKHGILNDPAHPAVVMARCSDSHLCFSTRNLKRKSLLKEGFGIGIQNAEARLREHYAQEAYSLDIEADELYYTIELKIKLV